MGKWYAVDLFTNEIHGPYDSDLDAIMATRHLAVDIQYRKFRGKRK